MKKSKFIYTFNLCHIFIMKHFSAFGPYLARYFHFILLTNALRNAQNDSKS